MKWKIPYIDFGRQYKKQEKLHLANFKKIMLSGDFVLRDEVLKFEKKISSLIGSKYVVSVNSCTDALLLALAAKGFKKSSEIITVGHTYVATLAAIKHVGLNPVLADISDDYNINVSLIEKLITKNTKAILPVHLYGHSCDMSSIMKIANKYNLSVIEDCAQSFGAKFKGKYVGTFGRLDVFSSPVEIAWGCRDGGL